MQRKSFSNYAGTPLSNGGCFVVLVSAEEREKEREREIERRNIRVCMRERERERGERERNFMRGLCSAAAAAEKRPSQGQDGCQMRVH